MVTPLGRPPKDLDSFQGRKWLERISRQGTDFTGVAGLEFLLITVDPSLPNARKILGSASITITDGGAGGSLIISLPDSGVVAGTFTKVTVDAHGIVTSAAAATTDDIAEGSNLYFTNGRVITALAGASTSDIAEGTNLYFTNGRVITALAGATTSDIAEGTNLYFTNARVLALLQHKVLFDHFADVGNVGTGEDDLYSDTISAGRLANNGEKISAQYLLAIASSGTATREIKAYFGGSLVLDSGALTFASGGTAEIWLTIIRESSSVVRVSAELVVSGITLQPIVTYTRITGLTLSATQVLKITGEAGGVGAATDDIVAKIGAVEWKAAA